MKGEGKSRATQNHRACLLIYMNTKEKLTKILKLEYGITSVHDLEAAIEKIGGVDISMFCVAPSTKKQTPPKNTHVHKANLM
jgi:hypothetical protein